MWKGVDLLNKFDKLREVLSNPELPDDIHGSQMRLQEHNHMKVRIDRAPVESLTLEGQTLLKTCDGYRQKVTGEWQGRRQFT